MSTKKTNALAKRDPAAEATKLILAGDHLSGGKLVETAIARLKMQYGETVLAFVTGQMDQMMRLKAQRDLLNGHILYIEQRLAAIDAGAFRVEGYPPNVLFTEERLNDGLR